MALLGPFILRWKDNVMSNYEQNAVSRAVWRWRAADAVPKRGNRPKRAFIQSLFTFVIGLVLFFVIDKVVLGWIATGLAIVILIAGLFFHVFFDGMERFGARLGVYAGTGITWLLLTPFFYIVFVPARVIRWISGHDPLCRRFPTDASTYWVRRPPVEKTDHYRRQY